MSSNRADPELPAIQAPVSAVLAHLPAQLARPLTVRQAAPVFPDPTLTHGHPTQQVARWYAQLEAAQATAPMPPHQRST